MKPHFWKNAEMSRIASELFKLKNGKDVVIRSLEPEDWRANYVFWTHLKTESEFTYQYPSMPEKTEKELKERAQEALDRADTFSVGAVIDGKIVGNLGCRPYIKDHPWLVHNAIFGMGIVKEFWGQGLGQKLIDVMFREAKKAGYKNIHGEVREHNFSGIALYKKLGFEFTGRKKKMAFINGKYYDDLLIFKEL